MISEECVVPDIFLIMNDKHFIEDYVCYMFQPKWSCSGSQKFVNSISDNVGFEEKNKLVFSYGIALIDFYFHTIKSFLVSSLILEYYIYFCL